MFFCGVTHTFSSEGGSGEQRGLREMNDMTDGTHLPEAGNPLFVKIWMAVSTSPQRFARLEGGIYTIMTYLEAFCSFILIGQNKERSQNDYLLNMF